MNKKTKKIQKEYITFAQLKRELLRDEKTREAYESLELEHAIRMAIIKKRIEKKLTQTQVAKRAGMHQSAIARFESDEDSPTLTTASRIFHAVGAKVRIY